MREAGHEADLIKDGAVALKVALEHTYDLILLDLMLPGADGLTVCRGLRAADCPSRILIVTARDMLEDKVSCLDAGADDYLVKPFQLAELLARVRALLRRRDAPPGVLTVADLTVEPLTRHVYRAGKRIWLSSTEFVLLEFLMRRAGETATRTELLAYVWEYDFGGNDNVVEVYISYLRRKIDKGYYPPLIHTVRGVGYRLGVESGA
jgi:DNA-binding response OmpR family regulator